MAHPRLRLTLAALALAACDPSVEEPPAVAPAAEACHPRLALDPSEVRFAVGAPGSDSEQVVTLTNTGCGMLFLDELAIVPVEAPFTIGGLSAVVLPAGGSVTANVGWEPNGGELSEGSLEVQSGDPDSPHAIALFAPSGALELSAEGFTDTPVGCSVEGEVILVNASAEAVSVGRMEVEGSSGELGIDTLEALNGPAPWRLGPGDRLRFRTRYTPTDSIADSFRVGAFVEDEVEPAAVVDVAGTAVLSEEVIQTWIVPAPPLPDVLLVIDDSPVMAEEEASVADELASLLTELQAAGLPAQLAVITTHDATLRGPVIASDDSDAAGLLAAQAAVGIATEGDASGLSAAWAALQADGGAGPGSDFLREDSTLHVITVADGADAGPVTWSELVGRGSSLRPDPGTFFVHGVNGDWPGGCATAASGGGYYDASVATGGGYLSLCGNGWGAALAEGIAGEPVSTGRFEFSEFVDETTLLVYVDGEERTSGWSYDSVDNALVFSDESAPGAGSIVEARYRTLPDCDS